MRGKCVARRSGLFITAALIAAMLFSTLVPAMASEEGTADQGTALEETVPAEGTSDDGDISDDALAGDGVIVTDPAGPGADPEETTTDEIPPAGDAGEEDADGGAPDGEPADLPAEKDDEPAAKDVEPAAKNDEPAAKGSAPAATGKASEGKATLKTSAEGTFTVKGNEPDAMADIQLTVKDGEDEYTAYCAEGAVEAVPTKDGVEYGNVFTSGEEYEGKTSNENKAVWRDKKNQWDTLKKVLYAGYPTDGASLGKEAEKDAFIRSTQLAVWYFTNSFTDDQMDELAKKIVEAAQDEATTVPDDYEMRFYTGDADGEQWQSVLALAKLPVIKSTKAMANGETGQVEIEDGDEAEITDEVELADLVKDTEYTLISHLYKDNGEQPFDTKETSGITSETEMPKTVTFDTMVKEAGTYSIKTELKWGDNGIVTHNGDLDDEAETVEIIVNEPEPKEGSLTTAVVAAEKKGAADKAVSLTYETITESQKAEEKGIDVKDIITYKDLVGGATYDVTGTLVEVDEAGKIVNEEVATASDTFTADKSSGEWALDFGKVELESYKKYVVFEEAVNKEDANDTAEHKDVDDLAQTILTEDENGNVPGEPVYEGELTTTVSANGKAAKADVALELTESEAAKVTISDTIKYKGLQGGDTYTVTGTLVKVADGAAGDEVATVTKEMPADASGEGVWQVDYEDVKLEAGTTYVVFEEAVNKDEAKAEDKAEHKDINDKAQTIVVVKNEVKYEGVLKTTVSINGKSASSTAARKLTAADAAKVSTVTDTIKYTGLQGGDTYRITGQLMKVEGDTATATGSSVVKEIEAAEDGEGTWQMDFTDVKLEAGTTYVVFEEAVNADKAKAEAGDTAEHKDIKDKAQMIVVAEKASSDSKSDSPKTGDDFNAYLWISLMGAAAAVLGVIVYRRRKA